MRVVMGNYDARAPGLGARFKRTFYATVDEIVFLPEKHAVKADGGIRTRLMRPFPYLVFDAVELEVVYMLTVQYAGRRPGYLRTVVAERRSHNG